MNQVNTQSSESPLIQSSKSDKETLEEELERVKSIRESLEARLEKVDERAVSASTRAELVQQLKKEAGLEEEDLIDAKNSSNAGLRNSGYRKVIEYIRGLNDTR